MKCKPISLGLLAFLCIIFVPAMARMKRTNSMILNSASNHLRSVVAHGNERIRHRLKRQRPRSILTHTHTQNDMVSDCLIPAANVLLVCRSCGSIAIHDPQSKYYLQRYPDTRYACHVQLCPGLIPICWEHQGLLQLITPKPPGNYLRTWRGKLCQNVKRVMLAKMPQIISGCL